MKFFVFAWTATVALSGILAPSMTRADSIDRKTSATRIAVLPLGGLRVEAETVAVLDEVLLYETARQTGTEVIGAADIDALLGAEKLKDALGCQDVVCGTEISGALGVRWLVAGKVSRLDGKVSLFLRLIDSREQQVVGRSETTAEDSESSYRALVADGVASLLEGIRARTADVRTGSADRVRDEAPTVVPHEEVLSTPRIKPTEAEPVDSLSPNPERFLSFEDWSRYEEYRHLTARPVSLVEWSRQQNEESQVLATAEFCSGVVGGVILAVGSDRGVAAAAFALLATLGIVDVLDVGAVEIRDSPPQGRRASAAHIGIAASYAWRY